MTPPLQLGILGLGEGRSILSACQTSDLATATLLCDLNEDLCKQRCAESGCERYTTSYAEMLADPSIEAVAIYTPDPLHAEHVRMAAEAGKHVICTKPLFKGLAEAADVKTAVEKAGIQVLVGQSCRFFHTFARQAEEHDRVGDLLSVEAHYNGDKRGGTSGSWGKAGAVDWLYTGLAHPVDLVYWHLGPIHSVQAVGTLSPAGKKLGQTAPDTLHVILQAESGAVGRVTGCYGSPHAHPESEPMIGCTLRGSTGTTQAWYPQFRYCVHTDDEGDVAYNFDHEHPYYFRWGGAMHHAGEFQNYLEHFVHHLLAGTSPRPNLDDGIHVIAVLEAIGEALSSSQQVQIEAVLERNNLGHSTSL
jgi:predicted dehydrogenase